MKLIKQTTLFFQEGNSDKVYEVDLCEMGVNQYVVNFRYGKRGATLNEGSKTAQPVSLAEAEKIFDKLANEKIKKGYQTELPQPVVADIPKKEAFVQSAEARNLAIIKRLQAMIADPTLKMQTGKNAWKASRVMWRAGELQLKAAIPFILALVDEKDDLELYCAVWALAKMQDEAAKETLLKYFNGENTSDKVKRIAGEGLFALLQGEERQKHLNYYVSRLPEAIKNAVLTNNNESLENLLRERVLNQKQKDYQYLDYLYQISADFPKIRHVLLTILREIPLKISYFRHVRHIFKIAEFRKDAEFIGIFAYRFERESANVYYYREESAYLQPTRDYLNRRNIRTLTNAGEQGDLYFVKLATAILLSYNKNYDYRSEGKRTEWPRWNGWNRVQIHYPSYYHKYFLNYILYGNDPDLVWENGQWYVQTEAIKRKKKEYKLRQKNRNTKVSSHLTENTVGTSPFVNWLNKLTNMVKGVVSKSVQTETLEDGVTPAPEENKRRELHPDLWDKLPTAYIQLLAKAKVDEVHAFALNNLRQHPDYQTLEAKIDLKLLKMFLSSAFNIPVFYGLELAKKKLANEVHNPELCKILINSHLEEARRAGLEEMEKHLVIYFKDTEMIQQLLFSQYEEVARWTVTHLRYQKLENAKRELLVGRLLMALMSANFAKNKEKFTFIVKTLEDLFAEELKKISRNIIYDLLNNVNVDLQSLGAKLLFAQKYSLKPAEISEDLYLSLFTSSSPVAREVGMKLFAEIADNELVLRDNMILSLCLSLHADLREQIRPIMTRLAAKYSDFGVRMADYLVPFLMRKESYEGVHADVAKILTESLGSHLGNVNKETTLRLLYSNYADAQNFAVTLLQNYINPNDLTLKQVIAIANHEILAAREWVWNFYENNLARIRYEREDATRLLDAKWDDSRAFAVQFFKEKFTENDWTPELLISIADSVRADIQALGRELITKYFEEKNGEEYLLKLSQHPAASMQTFATNYLARFAAGDLPKLQALEHYFRVVLMRVNKARLAKERVLDLLESEALGSEATAHYVASILTDISNTASIGDKARCIDILRKIGKIYPTVQMPVKFLEVELRG